MRVALAVTSQGGAEELLPRLWSSAEGHGRAKAPVFEPTLRTCDEAGVRAFNDDQRRYPPPDARTAFRQRSNMRALAEVAATFRKLGVPVILLSGMLLGWRRGCLAVPGDADADIGTFGPWLAEVGLKKLGETFGAAGHHFETQYCRDGLLAAGCELRVTLAGLAQSEQQQGGIPYVDIEVLFSAPPVSAGRMPGSFDRCKEDVCGRRCERCPFAYSLWAGSLTSQDRFYACPLPVGRFQLVAWMNETFWAPADVEGYLRAEYGHGWPVPAAHSEKWPTYRPCQAYMDAEISFSQYASFIPGLPSAAQVLEGQAAAEAREAGRIAEAAAFELGLWGGTASREQPPWRPRPEGRPKEQQEKRPTRRLPEFLLPLWYRVRFPLAAVVAVGAVAACMLLGWRCAAGDSSGCAWLLASLQARRLEPKPPWH